MSTMVADRMSLLLFAVLAAASGTFTFAVAAAGLIWIAEIAFLVAIVAFLFFAVRVLGRQVPRVPDGDAGSARHARVSSRPQRGEN